MAVSRIQELDIDNRSLLTGIYGFTAENESYVEKDLRRYFLWEELYLYLHEKGYITIFYNIENNEFSYKERDLELFFQKIEENKGHRHESRPQTSSHPRHPRCRGPLGAARPYTSSNSGTSDFDTASFGTQLTDGQSNAQELQSHYPDFQPGGNRTTGKFFQTKRRRPGIEFLDYCFRYVDRYKERKLAIVFTNPESSEVDPRYYDLALAKILPHMQGHGKADLPLRFLVLYTKANAIALHDAPEGSFFYTKDIRDLFFAGEQNEHRIEISQKTLFRIGHPGMDEIGNVLNKLRIENKGFTSLFNLPFDELCLRIWQQFKIKDPNSGEEREIGTADELYHLPIEILEEAILRMDNEKAINKLKGMPGLGKLLEQFEQYRRAYKRYKDKQKQGANTARFRPHMAFMGNPGTGKTTVARLFADVLREEGLLSRGHLTSVNVTDMISQYVGGTREQTRALCEKAKGGVLFLDEAYGLMSDANNNGNLDYGKQAIEVLIQFMENNEDFLVIIAGYTDEINNLINNGNQGFRSRFNTELGFFNFEDYKPDVLYQIARKKLPQIIKTTEAFDKALRCIIETMYAYRNKKFGNAREMENLVSNIINAYYDNNSEEPLDSKHIPDKFRILADPNMLDEDALLAELNDTIVGQKNIKALVKELFDYCLGQRTKMAEFGDTPEPRRLNYIFLGNPGTGKTTVARIIGNLLQKMGVLISPDKSVLTEILGGDMTDMATDRIKKLFEDNIGKVLFIDEAYELRNSPRVIGEIVANVTNPDYEKKMCIIMAGYTAEMRGMMNTNPGMKRRFDTVTFQDYTNEELWEILKRKVNDKESQCLMDEAACEQVAISYFATQSRGRDFGNAGIVESLFSILKLNRDKRYNAASSNEKKILSFARTILPEDFPVTRKRSRGKVLPPRERLLALQGIDKVREQFQRYCNAYHAYLEEESGESFRPHMVLMGAPGTGKTTVARLFGDILHEEGLLPQGQFIEATVGDLISQYVGDTRVKTQALCDSAKGGILFIDEAYGLMSGANWHGSINYGPEAIEVLIQFMENNDDSLVILAGYTKEMNDLLNNGNTGFRRRFNKLGFFEFEDYKPDVLYSIACGKLPPSTKRTPEFDRALRSIIEIKYAYRTKKFGNAGDMENLITVILSAYRESGDKAPLDIKHLPDQLRVLVDPIMLDKEIMLADLNDNIIGQQEVKTLIENLYTKCFAERSKILSISGYLPEMQRLNYSFMGNPGTGKTTVARIIGNLLQKMGILSSDSSSILTEISANEIRDMVLRSPEDVNQLFEDNIGKVLFIDEAYSLSDNREAIEAIVRNVTNPDYEKKMCIILAGYTREMHEMMRLNPGMSRRFDEIMFYDYTNEELWEILKRKVNNKDSQCIMDEDACKTVAIRYLTAQPRGRNFGNGGFVTDKLLPLLKMNRDNRYLHASVAQRNNPDFAMRIIPEDFPDINSGTGKSEAEILSELNAMIGLKKVKETINGLVADVKARRERAKGGNAEESKIGLNFVFRGNPGTGKTTVARLLGGILANFGLISASEVLTYTKANLIDGYVGGGSRNVEKMFEESVGKVLFIDEAYQLATHDSQEALDALTNMLTDTRFKDNLAVVLAGYSGKMSELIGGNPGLKSRFTHFIDFEDYSDDELTEIFKMKLSKEHLNFDDDVLSYARAYFARLKRNKDFGNARETEKLLGIVRLRQATRLQTATISTQDDYFYILPQDFPNFGQVNLNQRGDANSTNISPWDELKGMVGISSIIQKFEKYVKLFHYCQENPQNKIVSTFRPHMAFLGNPGTGKTTVARLFAKILHHEGLLTSNNFVEIGPDDLIGEYVGQSAPKARREFERARGGVLFIDEAYELYKKGKDGGGNQFGQDVITALIKFMEDDRDTIVILAGYTEETRYLIKYGNPGLLSRVTNEFVFEDYEPDVLFNILLKKLSDYELSDKFKEDMRHIIEYEFEHRSKKEWGNARTIENYVNEIFSNFLVTHEAKGIIDSDSIPTHLLNGIIHELPHQVEKASKDAANTHSLVKQPNISIDLTKNPSNLKATDTSMLKERATGLLESSSGEGTGFIISIPDRYILTCSHVIEGANENLTFRMNCNKEFETIAHVIWNNFEQDIALLQLDELPEDACYVHIDNDIEHQPQELTELVLCGYPDGSAFASTPSLISGSINNYEKKHMWNDRCFDTIYANVSATHGCSGGPVVRKSDMVLVGILQGGKEGGEIQFITDIHQLFRNNNLIIKC